jgi:hypothetical protein
VLPEKTKEILGNLPEMEKKVSLMNAIMMRRYCSSSCSETQHVMDDLVVQLGLKHKRKRKGRFGFEGRDKRGFLPVYERRLSRDCGGIPTQRDRKGGQGNVGVRSTLNF